MYLVRIFWELRGFCDDREKPITPGLLNDWIEGGGLLRPWERGIIYAMDRKFRDVFSEEVAKNEKRRAAQVDARGKKGRR